MEFWLRDSLTFRTVFLLVPPILLNEGGCTIVQNFVKMDYCLKCHVDVSGLVLIPVDSSPGSVCFQPGFLSLTLQAILRGGRTLPLSS